MKTYVVAFPEMISVNNFEHLPNQFTATINNEECRIIVTTDAKQRIWASKLVTNYDLLICSDRSSSCPPSSQNRKDVILLPRPTKPQMAEAMYLAAADCPGFYSIPTFELYSSAISQRGFWDLVPVGNYVLKCNDGARGIGQILVPDTVDLPSLIRAVANSEYDTPKLRQDFPGIVFNTAGEQSANEGIGMMRSQGIHLQAYVDEVISEHRLLINYDHILNCSREINGGDYPQAVGLGKEKNIRVDTVFIEDDSLRGKAFSPQINRELVKFIKALGLKFASMDIFLRRDGTWGCFEYSNQFSTDDHAPNVMCDWHKEFIVKTLTKLTNKESADV